MSWQLNDICRYKYCHKITDKWFPYEHDSHPDPIIWELVFVEEKYVHLKLVGHLVIKYVLHHYFTVTDSFELRDNKSLKRCQCTRKGKIDSLKLNLIDVGSNKITAQLKYACQCPIYEVALISKQNTNAIS